MKEGNWRGWDMHISGLTYGNVDLEQWMYVEDIDPTAGTEFSLVRNVLGAPIGRRDERKIIRVTGTMKAFGDRQEVHESFREMIGRLHTDKPKELRHRDDPDRYELAMLERRPELDYRGRVGRVTLTFLCDTASYGEERTATLVAEEPAPVTTDGTYTANPVIAVQGVLQGQEVSVHSISPEGIQQTFQFIARQDGDHIIDTVSLRVSPPAEYSYVSAWPKIEPYGHNIYTCSHACEMSWKERWR